MLAEDRHRAGHGPYSAQSRIIVLTEQHGQPLGTQLQAILQRESAYRLDVLACALLDSTAGVQPRPDQTPSAHPLH
jgi:hypothetical protein